MCILKILPVLALALAAPAIASGLDPTTVPAKQQTKAGLYLSPERVPAFLSERPGKVLFLDVRTPEETAQGMAEMVDANVPSMLQSGDLLPRMVPNPRFQQGVDQLLAAKGLGHNATIVLICRSGGRSAAAANLLWDAGHTQVYSVVEGFDGDQGWKAKGLPWSANMDPAKKYRPD